MSRQILFVGGPKHGEIIEIKDEPKLNYIEPAKEEEESTSIKSNKSQRYVMSM